VRFSQQIEAARGTIRQLAVTGLGTTARAVIGRYAHRMVIKQRLAETIRSSAPTPDGPHRRTGRGAVGVGWSGVSPCAHRLADYATATFDPPVAFPQLARRVLNRGGEILIRLDCKTYCTVLGQLDLREPRCPGGEVARSGFDYE
jgi:hypothetical protein